MSFITQSSIIQKDINYTSTFRNGGFVMYLKLYYNLIPLYRQGVGHLSLPKRIFAWLMFVFKTPWWLFIKPLGVLYKRKRILRGHVYILDGRLSEQRSRVKKYNVHYIMGVPVLIHTWFLTHKDVDDMFI